MHFFSHLQSEEEIHPPSKIKRLKTTEEKKLFWHIHSYVTTLQTTTPPENMHQVSL